MCRSIKTLRHPESEATEEEIRAAARQFVRKVTGFREPSVRNAEAFERAIDEISGSSRKVLSSLRVKAPTRAS